jgi:hypothetical protein
VTSGGTAPTSLRSAGSAGTSMILRIALSSRIFLLYWLEPDLRKACV